MQLQMYKQKQTNQSRYTWTKKPEQNDEFNVYDKIAEIEAQLNTNSQIYNSNNKQNITLKTRRKIIYNSPRRPTKPTNSKSLENDILPTNFEKFDLSNEEKLKLAVEKLTGYKNADCEIKQSNFVCQLFLNDKCTRLKNECNMKHTFEKEYMPHCYHYLNGECVKENCYYLHVDLGRFTAPCKTFTKKGKCKKGPNCQFYHFSTCETYRKHKVCNNKNCILLHPKRTYDGPDSYYKNIRYKRDFGFNRALYFENHKTGSQNKILNSIMQSPVKEMSSTELKLTSLTTPKRPRLSESINEPYFGGPVSEQTEITNEPNSTFSKSIDFIPINSSQNSSFYDNSESFSSPVYQSEASFDQFNEEYIMPPTPEIIEISSDEECENDVNDNLRQSTPIRGFNDDNRNDQSGNESDDKLDIKPWKGPKKGGRESDVEISIDYNRKDGKGWESGEEDLLRPWKGGKRKVVGCDSDSSCESIYIDT